MNVEDLYILFRKEQASFLGRPYRIPKNVSVYIETKLSPQNKENLKTLSLWFYTKWQNIDPEKYMKCGFDIYGKCFTYTKFFDDKVLKHYIAKDKAIKFNEKNDKQSLMNSITFVVKYMADKETNKQYSFFQNYCKQRDGEKKVIIEHYLKNKISALFFVYMLFKRYIILTEEEEILIPYIMQSLRDLRIKVLSFRCFLEKVEEKLNGKM